MSSEDNIFTGGTDWLGIALGGCQLSGVVKLSHGTPFTVVDTGGDNINWDGFSEDRPVILDPSILGTTIGDIETSREALPSEAFHRATPDPDDYNGIVGRNTFYGDGVRNVDVGLSKSFQMPTNDRLLLRLELYKVFNRRQWEFPNADFASETFGEITAQENGARSVQVMARYIF